MQPGQTISPQTEGTTPAPSSDDVPLPEPQLPGQSQVPQEQLPATPETNWDYEKAGQTPLSGNVPASHSSESSVQWTASEYIDHEKRAGWFISLSIGAVVIAIVLYLITKDLTTSIIVIIAAGLFGVTAARKPRTLDYELTSVGIRIENKYYPYDDFKSFSVIEEGAINSVQLMPLKRFLPSLSLYFPPDHEDIILNVLANYLPHEDRSHDPIDRLMRRVRF